MRVHNYPHVPVSSPLGLGLGAMEAIESIKHHFAELDMLDEASSVIDAHELCNPTDVFR